MSPIQRVIDHLRTIPNIEAWPTRQRHVEIRLALMDIEGADPDSLLTVQAIDSALTGVLPRLKSTLGLTDDELSGLIGKSRATVQAYITGRLKEQLTAQACNNIIELLGHRVTAIDRLVRDVETARAKAIS